MTTALHSQGWNQGTYVGAVMTTDESPAGHEEDDASEPAEGEPEEYPAGTQDDEA